MTRIQGFCFFLCLLAILSVSGQTFSSEAKAASLSSKKVLMIIASKDFHDQEFIKPKKILEKNGIKITIASTSLRVATGMYELRVKPDLLIKQAKADNYDAIIFVGGIGASALADDPSALSLVREAQRNNKIIGALCIAPVILAKAGILEGKKAAVSPYGINDLKKAKAFCSGKKVEIDGNIITGGDPGAAEDFGNAIIKALSAIK